LDLSDNFIYGDVLMKIRILLPNTEINIKSR